MTDTAAPTPARYEPMSMPGVQGYRRWGVWDNRSKTFVVGEAYRELAGANDAAARLNAFYGKAIAP